MKAKKKEQGMSVFLDGDLVLALNRVREQVREQSENSVFGTALTPTIGWLARSFLREKLGVSDAKSNDLPSKA